MKKGVLSFILLLCIIIALFPVQAIAETSIETAQATAETQESEPSMSIYSDSLSIDVGGKTKLGFEIFDKNITDTDILNLDWFIDDTDIAEFETIPSSDSWSAVVVGKKEGHVIAGATVTYNFLGETRYKNVACGVYVGENTSAFILEFSGQAIQLNKTKTVSLKARDKEKVSSIEKITWIITDTTVAALVSTPRVADQTVELKGLKEGEISIFATVIYNGGIEETYGNKLIVIKDNSGGGRSWVQYGTRWAYQFADGSWAYNWQKIDNIWYYFGNDGWMVTGWQQIGGRWYYFNSSGAMVTGWQQISGTWYYFNSSGAMLTGWQQIEGTWYYFYSSGEMAANTVIDGCTLDASGAWVQNSSAGSDHWVDYGGGQWAYQFADGNWAYGWQKIDGKWYHFGDDGWMKTGWAQLGAWYYFGEDGAMATGWQEIDGEWYYFDNTGAMVTDTVIDGYYINASGIWEN